MLIWDGLQVHIPDTLEPVSLNHGFIRLFGGDTPAIDLRFGPGKTLFDPKKDGRRMLQASSLAPETMEPCRAPWVSKLPGILYNSSRLYVLQFRESQGIVAALFSAPPSQNIIKDIFTPLQWTPLDSWRRWCCYDITFETPPNFALYRSNFRPGSFHLTFTKRSSKLLFDRLAPANVLLAGGTLKDWCSQHLSHDFYNKTTILRWSDTEVDFERQPPSLARILPWLPGFAPPLRGKIRHLCESNKILLVTQQGPATAEATSFRINASYAITPSVKT